jgi:hypothetical protein
MIPSPMPRSAILLALVTAAMLGCEPVGDPLPLDEIKGAIQYSPAQVLFPPSPLLQSVRADLTVGNIGNGPLPIDQVALPSPSFLVNFQSLTIAPNESAVLVITFTPTSIEAVSATLELVHPAVEPGNTLITVGGSGLAPCDVDLVNVYADIDDDSFGDGASPPTLACGAGPGQATIDGDCNDQDAGIHPDAEENCQNGLDDDCDTLVDADESVCITTCNAHDDCGLNQEGFACPPLGADEQLCQELCRHDVDCVAGQACRPMAGTLSMGFCDVAGSVAEGEPCTGSNECAVGMCTDGACRVLCQRSADCPSGEECGAAFYDANTLGGTIGRRMTTACRPIGGQATTSQSCLVEPTVADSALCASLTCDLLPWAYGLAADAPCAPVCAGAGDCGPSEACGIVYTGAQEVPAIGATGEGPGRYLDAFAGCFTPVNHLIPEVFAPGGQPMGGGCDATSSAGDLSCRSFLCATFAPIVGLCTDFCARDVDCDTALTPGWRCRAAELNHASVFLQSAQIADISKFTLVGVCAP